ncbi:type III pantothenate kinase [Synechococcus sp. NOUM97013]|uniref:type III pantothenate kinase n=1 Tax=Synechococcus sp. NOUM97013 TaxID=1442555 RepID=UPI0016477E44|nr:type III pantothenate kinase [Synechococcus sp. NOUM97013]QNI74584.1 type III pantothenate kinase [Synechococcus sp. NOUM97013]
MEAQQHCLLIGNSRWHWAERTPANSSAAAGAQAWHFSHGLPTQTRLDDLPSLTGWAAVGPVPSHPLLQPTSQLGLAEIPLAEKPSWLGVDRALAGWGAWERAGNASSVMVVDAGTVLSLTRVSRTGCFAGGWLAAGVSLQLRAMAQGTVALQLPDHAISELLAGTDFPIETAQAMRRGVVESLVGLILQAQEKDPSSLWLCGGDAPLLMSVLASRGLAVTHAPDLVMQSMVALVSSGPDR